ncbi:MAG: hypothetical protein JRC93_00785 [Deltaproteobacteria bacterium]|nr:hypothetical protein [Deltaproteobacteria bacterium]
MERILPKTNHLRLCVLAAMVAACVCLEYYFHVVHGITIIYTHFFYLPIIAASFWWGVKGGLSVSASLFLIHILFSLPSASAADLARGLMFIFVGVTAGILDDRHVRAKKALHSLSARLEDRVKRRTADLEERAIELTTANEALNAEIKRRKEVEIQLREALKKRESHLSEIHHRLRNNLQVVSSTLDIGSMQTRSREAITAIEDARSKIHTMALIHSQLYESGNFDQVDMGRHILEMTALMGQIYSEKKMVDFDVRVSDIHLPLAQAEPCSLILNELIANAWKHSFAAGEKGTVRVLMEMTKGGGILLIVSDDGSPFLTEDDFLKAKGLGLRLVRNLVRKQLKGSIDLKLDNGTEFIIKFKKQEVDKDEKNHDSG